MYQRRNRHWRCGDKKKQKNINNINKLVKNIEVKVLSLESQYKSMFLRISDMETKHKVANEKMESIDEEYSNKFKDTTESFDTIIEDKMSLFVTGFEW